jgi:hypothetical protein
MGGNKGGGSEPRIGDEATAVFLRALGRGAKHEEAARAAGFSRSAFFRLRKRDSGFAALWDVAIELSAGNAAQRGPPRGAVPAPGEGGEDDGYAIQPGTGRRLQRRRTRSLKFTPKRQDVFFAHFAGTCNLAEAAEVAGVSESTVFKCLDRDPDFAARFRSVLAQSYQHLETELLRRRLEAQKRLGPVEATGEFEPEFDRALKLLQRWERKDGSLGPRRQVRAAREPHSFDEAIDAIERKLKAIGIPIRDFRVDDEAEGEGEGEGEAHLNSDAGGDSHFIGPPQPDDREGG